MGHVHFTVRHAYWPKPFGPNNVSEGVVIAAFHLINSPHELGIIGSSFKSARAAQITGNYSDPLHKLGDILEELPGLPEHTCMRIGDVVCELRRYASRHSRMFFRSEAGGGYNLPISRMPSGGGTPPTL